MAADRSVQWALYRDASCAEEGRVSLGSISVGLAQPPTASDSSQCAGVQLVPELQRRVLAQGAAELREADAMEVSNESFPVAVEDLTLGSRAMDLGLMDGKASVYCKLQVDDAEQPTETTTDWFDWKWQRADDYRARGNEAFKQQGFTDAVKLYKRALAWLEPPTDVTSDLNVEYSAEEKELVNPIATACYANMATCYSKLDRDGDVELCIAAASNALALDDKHVKARYRRSQAYAASKEFDLALADLTKLRELEPDNKLFRSALSRAQTAKTQLRKKQQSAFANLFDK